LEREFYTDGSGTAELEYRLGRLEQRVAPIFKQIIETKSTSGLTAEQRHWVDLFLAVQLERTQGGRIRRKQLFRATSHFTEALKRRGTDTSLIDFDLTTDDVKRSHLASLDEIGIFVEAFKTLNLGVRTADGAVRFTTSDEPLIFRNDLDVETVERLRPKPAPGPTRAIHASRILRVTDRDNNGRELGNLGIRSPGIEIYLALSPDVLLAAVDPRVFPLGSESQGWDDMKVKRLREQTLAGSVRFVYSDDSSFEAEEAWLGRKPEWRDPERPRVSVFYMSKELVEASRRNDFDLPWPKENSRDGREGGEGHT